MVACASANEWFLWSHALVSHLRASLLVPGGVQEEVWDDPSEFGFGRRFSQGDPERDAALVRVPVKIHVYDLGTDNFGSSLLRTLNTHSLGAFHVGVEIGFRPPENESRWEFSYGWTDEDICGVSSCRAKASDNHNFRESIHLGYHRLRFRPNTKPCCRVAETA